MTTVSELARDILASIATDAGGATCGRWIDNRYREMLGKVKFRSMRQIGEVQLPALVTTGTVDMTRDSTTLTGTDTTWLTSPTSSPGQYWYFRTASAWYNVSTITANTTGTLATAFSEDDVSDGSFKMAKRFHRLATDARRLGTFVITRLRRELRSISAAELDIIAPDRILAGNIPLYVADSGVDTSGYRMVEFYPPPTYSEIVHYIYWKIPSALTLDADLPIMIDPYVLKEGVLVDAYRFEKAAALRKGNVEEAATWANEEAKQRTIWSRTISDAIRSDKGIDDLSMIVESLSSRRKMLGDIRTARDQVYANWQYP